MKSSLGRLRRFALHKSDAKDKIEFQHPAQLDDLSQASQNMQEMRDCYDSLLSAAAATANSAYEFSESLREMGACLMEKKALHDDDEASGRALLSLGKVQLELQKLVDSYRSHIFLTITNPSESLLNELRTVEEMKRQCDEKRNVYEYMMAQHKEKGRSKGGKDDGFDAQELQTARDEFQEEATLCAFRLKSLKQGQSRSLLTQAARHHAAQLSFFRKAVKSLEAVEPHVRLVTEMQHIDYQFSGFEDEDGEDYGDHYDPNEDGELSFEYRPNKQGLDVHSISRNSIGVGLVGISSRQSPAAESTELNQEKYHGDIPVKREIRAGSHSAPLFAEKKFDPAEKARQIQPSPTPKLNTYVLPTPVDVKGFIPSRKSSSDLRARPSDGRRTHNLWHSSPLEEKRQEKHSSTGNFSGPILLRTQSVLKESNINNASVQLPPPLVEERSFMQFNSFSSDTMNLKKQSFSGPLTSRPLSAKPLLSMNGPISSNEISQQVSVVLSGVPIAQHSSSPKISPNASPPPVSSPRISELHELPRPPSNLAARPVKSTGLIGHSAPLTFRNQEVSVTNKIPSAALNASPLPTPPLSLPRSLSISSRSQKAKALHVANHLESAQVQDNSEEVASPPLTPISFANTKGTVSDAVPQSGQIKGGN